MNRLRHCNSSVLVSRKVHYERLVYYTNCLHISKSRSQRVQDVPDVYYSRVCEPKVKSLCFVAANSESPLRRIISRMAPVIELLQTASRLSVYPTRQTV